MNSFSCARLYAPAFLMCYDVCVRLRLYSCSRWWKSSLLLPELHVPFFCFLSALALPQLSLRHLQRLWNPETTLWWYVLICNPPYGAYESLYFWGLLKLTGEHEGYDPWMIWLGGKWSLSVSELVLARDRNIWCFSSISHSSIPNWYLFFFFLIS